MTKFKYKTNYREILLWVFVFSGMMISSFIVKPWLSDPVSVLEVLGAYICVFIGASFIGLIGYTVGLTIDIHHKLSKGGRTN